MVAGMVPRAETIADIGCDHAYLSVWLLRERIAGFAYACDVRPGPLAKAGETIRFFHMQERAKTVLCDGLTGLRPGDAEVIVIAGMGGELMTRILADGEACVRSARCLVLQPQSDREKVRRKVTELGFVITEEQCLREDGIYYLCMTAYPRAALPDAPDTDAADTAAGKLPDTGVTATDRRTEPYAPWEYRYGRWLTERRDPTYLAWLTEECEKKTAMVSRLLQAGTKLAEERLKDATAELAELAGVMRRFFE